MNEELKQGLLGYIAACEENIQKYREMCDLAAVKAAEGMIQDFQKKLKELEMQMENA